MSKNKKRKYNSPEEFLSLNEIIRLGISHEASPFFRKLNPNWFLDARYVKNRHPSFIGVLKSYEKDEYKIEFNSENLNIIGFQNKNFYFDIFNGIYEAINYSTEKYKIIYDWYEKMLQDHTLEQIEEKYDDYKIYSDRNEILDLIICYDGNNGDFTSINIYTIDGYYEYNSEGVPIFINNLIQAVNIQNYEKNSKEIDINDLLSVASDALKILSRYIQEEVDETKHNQKFIKLFINDLKK